MVVCKLLNLAAKVFTDDIVLQPCSTAGVQVSFYPH